MVKSLSRHPDGGSGVALALLRVSCALIAFPALARLPLPNLSSALATILSAVLALTLVTGIGAKVFAFLLDGITLADVLTLRGDLELMMIAGAAACTALVLLGPGAYSIDAIIYGRRVIRLDVRSPDRGNDD